MAKHSSYVNNALAIERQYTPRQVETYQERVSAPTFSSGIAIGNSAGNQLRQALGLLGDAVVKEGQAMQTRQELTGRAEGQRAFNTASEADKQGKSAADIVSAFRAPTQSGSDYLMGMDVVARNGGQNNPFAEAAVQELQGKYVRDTIDREYQESIKNSPLLPTAQAEGQRYEKFVSDSLRSRDIDVRDNQMFSAGFHSDEPQKFLANDAAYRKRKDAEDQYNFGISVASELGKKLDARLMNLKKPEEISEFFSSEIAPLFQKVSATGMPLDDRDKLLKNCAEIVAYYGNPEALETFGNMEVCVGIDGKTQTVKDRLPTLNVLTQEAANNGRFIHGTKVQDFLDEYQKIDKQTDRDERQLKLQREDPETYYAVHKVLPTVDNRLETERKQREREAAQTAKLQAKLDRYQATTARNTGEAERTANALLDAWDVGASNLANGQSASDWTYEKLTVNSLGFIEKNRVEIPKQVAEKVFMQRIQDTVRNGDPTTKFKALSKLVASPKFKDYGRTCSQLVENAANQLGDQGDQAANFATLKDYYEWYKADPASFYVFSPEASKVMQLMSYVAGNGQFSEITHGTQVQNYKRLLDEQKNDPTAQSAVKKVTDRFTAGVTIKDADGDDVTVTDQNISTLAKTAAEIAVATRAANPTEFVTNELSKHWTGIKVGNTNIAFPKNFVDTLGVPDPAENIKKFIEANADKDADGNPLCYISGDKVILSSSDPSKRYSYYDFFRNVKYDYEHSSEEPGLLGKAWDFIKKTYLDNPNK